MPKPPYTNEQIKQLAEMWGWLTDREIADINIPALLMQLLDENDALRKELAQAKEKAR